MGESNAKKRTYRGCKCGCGCGTWSTYAPGHDARHVSLLVASTVASWADRPHDTRTVWANALRQLGTPRLQWKYREAVLRRTRRERGTEIKSMADASWQSRIHLARDVARVDEGIAIESAGFYLIAEIAAAMGWDRHSVNMRHS